jgi:Zn/Cd-binding protein ZinT
MHELINNLIYRSYAYNRNRTPEITPEQWQGVYPNTHELERQYQEELRRQSMKTQGFLTALMKPEYQNQGYGLTEDEDFLYLCKAGKPTRVFNARSATIEKVKAEIMLDK